ncbi:uncharacterized protein [Coffea arabica]|uniref:Uncharacterized protein isoform X1 n=2 Tax=Coffea arabica TaxID=13443 RepID=A0A6P6UNI9_COFAR|nr:auxilin-related protein 1-like isoform X1 [Coffea arabica]
MDEFGVLVESIGFKSQRNSAPMAHLKSKPKTNLSVNDGFPDISSANASRSSFYDNNDYFVDDLDGIFQSNRNNYSSSKKSQNFFDGGDDIFDGGSFLNSKPQKGIIDFDSVFDLKNSNSKSSSNFHGDDLLTSGPRKGDALDDFFGNLKKGGEEKGSQYDDLIPGFEGTSPSRSNDPGNTRMASKPKVSQPSSGYSSKSSSAADDPFLVFESSRSEENTSSWPFSDLLEQNAGNSSVESSLDEFEKFARGMPPGDAHDKPSGEAVRNIKISLKKKEDKARDNASGRDVNTDAKVVHEKRRGKEKDRADKDKVTNCKKESVGINIFGVDTLSNVNGPRSQLKDPDLDALFNEKREPEVKETSIQGSSRTSKDFDGLSSLFEGPEFQEIEGETVERRSRRLNQHIKIQERMFKALEEKTQRDLEAQYEQEERHRLADCLDNDIKRWSAGKENNLRALLSSLQDVLWPESGWQPVSLADLITSVSVIKVYKKASMCFHPDKVQQRGCNLQQKYIAEKVFDVLKEARSNFSEL